MGSRRLTPADAVWLYSEWENNGQTVSALMWTDQEVDAAELRSIISERLLNKYPAFTQKIRKSRNPLYLPHWEDDPSFDLDNHFQVDQLPEPGSKEQLAELIGEQIALGLPLLEQTANRTIGGRCDHHGTSASLFSYRTPRVSNSNCATKMTGTWGLLAAKS